MREFIITTGMILETSPVNDYDRRVVILTKDYGKITAFCKGARRQNNKMMAVTNPFAFGNFKLYEGKTAYNLVDADITYYFEELRIDYEGTVLGMYLLEYASYYTRENNDELLMLKLLFQSVRAIIKPNIDNRLIRAVFEIKALVINGEYPGIPADKTFQNATLKAVSFIVDTSIEKLYTFAVNVNVLEELLYLGTFYRKKYIDYDFKSLELLENSMLKI